MAQDRELSAYTVKTLTMAGTLILLALLASITTCSISMHRSSEAIAEINARQAEALQANGYTPRQIQCFQVEPINYEHIGCDEE